MSEHPKQITFEDVEELLELIQLCWMRAPDRFDNCGPEVASDLQECLLKLVELRSEILDGVTSNETPLNLVLYVKVVIRTKNCNTWLKSQRTRRKWHFESLCNSGVWQGC